MKFPVNVAHACYDVLHDVLGAREYWREDFTRTLTSEDHTTWREYRLSFWEPTGYPFGGKFWVSNGRIYAQCYSEHSTPVREALVNRANERLAEILRVSGIDPRTI